MPSYHPVKFTAEEYVVINQEIQKLIKKEVISLVKWNKKFFFSSVFTVPKKDESFRIILNLKRLNLSVKYQHFKMETLDDVLNVIKPGVWMGSIDLKDAYYSIPVHSDFQKIFTFTWDQKYYQFAALPNGFGPAVRICATQVFDFIS